MADSASSSPTSTWEIFPFSPTSTSRASSTARTSKSLAETNDVIAQFKYPLDEFFLFPKLPPELRVMIWQAYILDPEIIGVECIWDPNQLAMSGWTYNETAGKFLSRWIGNREAREEVRRLPEKVLITYPPNVPGGRIMTNPAFDIVFFHAKDLNCEFGLLQMLMDLATDCVPLPYIPKLAIPYKWHKFFFEDLENMEEYVKPLQLFGTKELIFVVGEERKHEGIIVGLPYLTVSPEEILNMQGMVGEVRNQLKIHERDVVTWKNLKMLDHQRMRDARVISDWNEWPLIEISYRGVN